MKKPFITLSAAVLIAGAVSACSLFQVASGNMPSKIGFTIPDTMYDATKGDPEPGPAYQTLKVYVTAGKNAADIIDTVLGTVSQYKSLFMASAGNVISSDDGKWFLFQKLSTTSFYLYYGETAAKTNIYMDWIDAGNDLYSGKVVLFMNGANDVVEQAIVYFDTGATYPYLDIYVDPTATSIYSEMRVRLEKLAEGEIRVQARTLLTNETDFPASWNIIGYGKQDSYGGAIGYAIGSTNFTYNTVPGMATNYIYREDFNSTGIPFWQLATFDMYTNSAIYVTSATDISHSFQDTPPDASVTAQLDGMTVLTVSTYPAITLP